MAVELEARREVEYELKEAIEHLQRAYEKSTMLPRGIRGMIRLQKARTENTLWYVRRSRIREKGEIFRRFF